MQVVDTVILVGAINTESKKHVIAGSYLGLVASESHVSSTCKLA
ncbi:MAG: hypothetical protein ACYC7D_00860 [Nitrososphaerales archaeon]